MALISDNVRQGKIEEEEVGQQGRRGCGEGVEEAQARRLEHHSG